MKFSTSILIAASAAAVNARVIERQLLPPQIFALKLVSSDSKWDGKYVHPSPLGGSPLSIASASTTTPDATFMLINTNLFHASDSTVDPSTGSPVSAAAIPSFFNGVESAKTPLYFVPVDEIPSTGDITSQVTGFEVGKGFALNTQGHLTHGGSEAWLACDGHLAGGEFGRLSGLYLTKGDIRSKGCVGVQVAKA